MFCLARERLLKVSQSTPLLADIPSPSRQRCHLVFFDCTTQLPGRSRRKAGSSGQRDSSECLSRKTDLTKICDSPVSGGSVRAAAGTLVIMASGAPTTVANARPVLDALTRLPEGKLRVVGDIPGIASDFKLINQVVCATQITLTGCVSSLSPAKTILTVTVKRWLLE